VIFALAKIYRAFAEQSEAFKPGYCKERLSWLAAQTTAARRIRSPSKGETFDYRNSIKLFLIEFLQQLRLFGVVGYKSDEE